MDGLDIANERLAKEEELSDIEENILEQHTIFSKKKTTKDSGKGNIAVICILLGMAAVGGLYFYSNKGSFIKKKKGPIIDDGEEYIEIPVANDNKDSADSTDE